MPIYTPLRFRISPSPRNPKKKTDQPRHRRTCPDPTGQRPPAAAIQPAAATCPRGTASPPPSRPGRPRRGPREPAPPRLFLLSGAPPPRPPATGAVAATAPAAAAPGPAARPLHAARPRLRGRALARGRPRRPPRRPSTPATASPYAGGLGSGADEPRRARPATVPDPATVNPRSRLTFPLPPYFFCYL